VVLLAPSNGLRTTTSSQTLWWEYVENADKYNVQIVSPSWDSINQLIADTNITGNKFSITLPPGEYDWGVSAFNSSGSTPYRIYHLVIDTASSLSNQQVILISPHGDLYTNKKQVSFQWYKLPLATEYIFDIKYSDWSGTKVVPTIITQADSASLELEEGVYAWGVQAKNDDSYTYLYSTRKLTIDITAPGKPVITLPAKNYDTLTTGNLTISWSQPLTSLAPMKDSVIISADTLFSPSKIKEKVVVTESGFELTGYAKGKYFCKIRAFDLAGNIGPFSLVRTFYVGE
jgi:hypothetical protein